MFNVGDEVGVVDSAPYSITTAGSKGTVIRTFPGSMEVRFMYLSSGRYGEQYMDTYDIGVKYLTLTHIRTKEENIIYKINQMSIRFDKRKNKPSGSFEENLHEALYL